MGSPSRPILTDIFMGKLGQTKFKHTVEGTALYCRYIDDTFVVYNNRKHSMCLFNLFNKAHNDIDFTIEGTVDGKFLFLNVGIKQISDGTLQRHIHCRNT